MSQPNETDRVRALLSALILSTVTSLTIIACAGGPESGNNAHNKEKNQEEKQTDAADREYESRLKQAETDLAQQEQSNRKKAQTLYEKARTLLKKGEFETALEETNQALELDPTHKEAQNLKDTLLSLMGERRSPSANMEKLQDRLEAKIDQNLVRIQQDLEDSRELIDQEEYSKAEKKLQSLKTRLKGADWMDSKKFKDYKEQVNSLLETASIKAEKRKELIQQKLKEKSKQQAAEAEKKERMQEIRWTDRMMSQAIRHFENEEYEETIELTETILSRYPNFQDASDLKTDAQKARSGKFERELRVQKAEEWKNFQERMIAKRIPQSELLKFPSEEYWKKVNERATRRQPISSIGEQGQQQNLFSLRKKLKSDSTTLEFAQAQLPSILDSLRDKHDLNIVLDSDAEEKANQERSVFVRDLRLGNAISVIAQKYGLRHDLRDNTVFITTPENVRPQAELQIFKTRDLVYLLNDVNDFGTKKISGLQSSSQRENNIQDLNISYSDSKTNDSYPYEEEESTSDDPKETEKEKQVNLADMVKKHVAPDSWEHENTGIRQSYSGMLFVRNTPEVLANVERFVDDLRSFAGSMVNVSVHFLSLRDEFLEHYGVEFKQVDQSGNQNPGVSAQTGTPTFPGPGIDYNFLSNFSTSSSLPAGQFSTLQNSGGLGITYGEMGGTDYQAVMRALQKDDKSYILDSSQFTLFNTQRAHISIGEQNAFIQDFDVQPSAGASSFDPIIGVVGTGLILDVRPIISFDRRYVTLQLLPSLTSDVSFQESNILEIGGFPLVIQLPRIQKKSVSTTVRLPDHGSLLLGGLTRSETLNKQQGTPVLQDIPILSALFKETVKRDIGREVQILVKVEILNTAEEQQKAYGSTSTTGLQNQE